MNNEIKEILDELKEYASGGMSGLYPAEQQVQHLLDYITNLQQENEKLKELCDEYEEEHSNEFKIWKEERHELLDYKSRCEKASEYIEEMLYPIGTCVNGSDLPYDSIESLLNILQNGSDSQ